MAHGADDAHLIPATQPPGERTAEHRVGLAGAVHVGGDDGVDAAAGRDQRREALVVDRLAEVHEAPAAPGADGDATGIEVA